MEGCVGDDDAAHVDRSELGDGGESAGPADLQLDRIHDGDGFLGGEFMRQRPAGIAADESETPLPVEAVHFIDDAVDVVVEPGALELDVVMESEQLLDGAAELAQRIGGQPVPLEPMQHAPLRVGSHLAHLAPGVGEKAQRPRGGHFGVELAERAGRGIARIGEHGTAGGGLLLVELQECGPSHVDLTADLTDVERSTAAHLCGNVADAADVGGDVFPLRAVTSGRAAHQHAAFVAQR